MHSKGVFSSQHHSWCCELGWSPSSPPWTSLFHELKWSNYKKQCKPVWYILVSVYACVSVPQTHVGAPSVGVPQCWCIPHVSVPPRWYTPCQCTPSISVPQCWCTHCVDIPQYRCTPVWLCPLCWCTPMSTRDGVDTST